jgi:molybdopterin synthase sulfur carrier subunit
MTVQVLFFSVLRDVTGCAECEWQCDGAETVGDLLTLFYVKWPKLETWDGALLLALNQIYVKRDAKLVDGAELAIMPPVQGG